MEAETANALSRLSVGELNDLGISRSDIPVWADPAAVLWFDAGTGRRLEP